MGPCTFRRIDYRTMKHPGIIKGPNGNPLKGGLILIMIILDSSGNKDGVYGDTVNSTRLNINLKLKTISDRKITNRRKLQISLNVQ